jgi:hypothetical protein
MILLDLIKAGAPINRASAFVWDCVARLTPYRRRRGRNAGAIGERPLE